MNSFSERIKVEIEIYANKMMNYHPFYLSSQQGTFDKNQLTYYIYNIWYLIRHTSPFIKLAQKSCLEQSLPLIYEFLEYKYKDEMGHDKWAEEDFKKLQISPEMERAIQVTVSMDNLVDFIKRLAVDRPFSYICYAFLAEYLTVLVAPSWVDGIRQQCGLQYDLSVLVNHMKIDQRHYKEDIEILNKLNPSEPMQNDALEDVKHCMYLLERYYDEIFDFRTQLFGTN